MRRLIIMAALALLQCPVLFAQEPDDVEVLGPAVEVDSLLLGKSVYDVMPDGVMVNASGEIRESLERLVASNGKKMFSGYRVRIYQSSERSARNASLSAMTRFNESFPYVTVYRSYTSPFFKVTVGNFRTRLEAEEMLDRLRNEFPDAVVVREKFKFPDLQP